MQKGDRIYINRLHGWKPGEIIRIINNIATVRCDDGTEWIVSVSTLRHSL